VARGGATRGARRRPRALTRPTAVPARSRAIARNPSFRVRVQSTILAGDSCGPDSPAD
jgi:hypothetical protein